MGGIYEYAVEMCSGAMMYMNISSGIQKLMMGIQRHRQHGDGA
jgi:hypothetical protein